MTYKEAIEILQEEHDYCQEMSYVIKALEMAIDALEKQIPKKPIIRKTEDYFGYTEYILCPNCEKVEFGYERPCFCRLCGQAIDWEVSK